MKPKSMIIAGLACFSLGVSSMALMSARSEASSDDLYRELKPFMETITLIQANYVDTDKTKSKDLIEGAIKGMVANLDPFSQYMDVEESNDMKEETEGTFGGLGIEISIKNKTLTVVSPIEDTPADKAGLKSGDSIVKINGESTEGMQVMDAVHKLRGEPGTKVTITVYRDSFPAPKDFVLVRAVIKIQTVKFNMLDNNVGYIRLTQFMGHCDEDFTKALQTLKDQGAKNMIVDVRNNPGGLLDAAASISSNFVAKGDTVVSIAGRNKSSIKTYDSDGGIGWKGGLVVLINGGSASASEIFAGAVQDHALGVIVGTQSFGKGSVQTIMSLSDGSALRLTTAKYLTPKGRTIHGLGITPDVVSDDEYYSKIYVQLSDEGDFEGFAKEYLLGHPGFSFDEDNVEKKAIKVSEHSMDTLKPESLDSKVLKDFIDYAKTKNKDNSEDEIMRDQPTIIGRIKEEVTRIQKGEDAARAVALMNDSQIREALSVLKVQDLVKSRDRDN
jgi:carboxyl-terminal processing protease